MIDLHTHTFLSDGQLGPAEHIRRAEVAGYRVLGFADHMDLATLPLLLPPALDAARVENALGRMTVLAGCELTHVRPEHMREAVHRARELGAQYVVVHGESLAEPVQAGTNRAAIEAGCDILAHPGLIAEEDIRLAAQQNVMLEISAKAGHCLANGHVAARALAHGARLLFGSDAHGPDQMLARPQADDVCRGAGLADEAIAAMFAHAGGFARHRLQQAEADEVADW